MASLHKFLLLKFIMPVPLLKTSLPPRNHFWKLKLQSIDYSFEKERIKNLRGAKKFFYSDGNSWMWWFTAVITALGKLR